MKSLTGSWCVFLFFTPGVAASQTVEAAPPAVEIIRRSVEALQTSASRARDYTYLQRSEVRELDKAGQVRDTESTTWDVVMLGGRPYRKKIAKDDTPLSGAEAKKAEEEFEKEVRKREKESEASRQRRLEKERKQEEEARRYWREIPDAFDFNLLREEPVDGRPCWVIAAEPRRDYRPKERGAAILSKFRGTLWVDENDYQWVKVEAETIDTIAIGWVLARLAGGTKISFQQTRVSGDVWLPSHVSSRIDARVALFKKLRAEVDVRYSNYRKFTTDSRVLPGEEAAGRREAGGSPRK
jgi:hypothetical protein